VHTDRETRVERKSWCQNIRIADCHGNTVAVQRQVLNILKNDITEVYGRFNQLENL